MKHLATVLYEDRAADDRNFALHRLVVRCVHDTQLERAVALDFGELHRDGLRGIPCNSNNDLTLGEGDGRRPHPRCRAALSMNAEGFLSPAQIVLERPHFL